MSDRVFEGVWEDVVGRADLRGHRVRVIVLDDAPPTGQVTSPPAKESRQEWLRRFHGWVASHGPVGHFVDDSRESIYGGTVADEAPEEWVRRLREWAASYSPVRHFADDSRESIYGGTVDDPR